MTISVEVLSKQAREGVLDFLNDLDSSVAWLVGPVKTTAHDDVVSFWVEARANGYWPEGNIKRMVEVSFTYEKGLWSEDGPVHFVGV